MIHFLDVIVPLNESIIINAFIVIPHIFLLYQKKIKKDIHFYKFMIQFIKSKVNNMKKFIAGNFQNIEPSSMLETNALAKSYNDVINLSIGDPDLNTDKEIIDACYKDLLNGHTHYSNPLGYEDLRKAIIDDYYNEYNIKFNLDEIIITTSATHAMFLVLKALLDKDDEVIIKRK